MFLVNHNTISVTIGKEYSLILLTSLLEQSVPSSLGKESALHQEEGFIKVEKKNKM